MTSMIDRGAEAMRTKRRELIAQPLDRIWPDLMRAAIEAYEAAIAEQEQSTHDAFKEAEARGND